MAIPDFDDLITYLGCRSLPTGLGDRYARGQEHDLPEHGGTKKWGQTLLMYLRHVQWIVTNRQTSYRNKVHVATITDDHVNCVMNIFQTGPLATSPDEMLPGCQKIQITRLLDNFGAYRTCEGAGCLN